jgi:hypothetical protein
LWFADIDMYSALTENRFDWRRDRVSWEDIVFCRETGWNDEVEEVEVLEAGCSIVATDIMCS